jgi:hypothetical protein
MSRRLHIIISDEQYDLLNEAAHRTRVSMAEQVRTLLDRELRPQRRPRKIGFGVVLTRRPDEPFVGRRPGIRIVD